MGTLATEAPQTFTCTFVFCTAIRSCLEAELQLHVSSGRDDRKIERPPEPGKVGRDVRSQLPAKSRPHRDVRSKHGLAAVRNKTTGDVPSRHGLGYLPRQKAGSCTLCHKFLQHRVGSRHVDADVGHLLEDPVKSLHCAKQVCSEVEFLAGSVFSRPLPAACPVTRPKSDAWSDVES